LSDIVVILAAAGSSAHEVPRALHRGAPAVIRAEPPAIVGIGHPGRVFSKDVVKALTASWASVAAFFRVEAELAGVV
jgi:hypothetical protein